MPRYAFLQTNSNEQVTSKVLASILSPTAFSFGADMIAQYEYTGVGLQFSNLGDGDFNFGICLFMLWIDFYIYGFLALYLDQVLPQEFGTPKPLLFFFSYKYWCPGNGASERVLDDTSYCNLPEFRSDTLSEDLVDSIEAIPTEMQPSVKVFIQGLQKRYPDGKLAVKDMSMVMLEDQITCLLG
jgi:hypothetical protein